MRSGRQRRSAAGVRAIVTTSATSVYAQPSRKTQARAESAIASGHFRSGLPANPMAAAMKAYAKPWLGLYRKFATQNGGTGGRGFMAREDRPSTANAMATPVQASSGEPSRRRIQAKVA